MLQKKSKPTTKHKFRYMKMTQLPSLPSPRTHRSECCRHRAAGQGEQQLAASQGKKYNHNPQTVQQLRSKEHMQSCNHSTWTRSRPAPLRTAAQLFMPWYLSGYQVPIQMGY